MNDSASQNQVLGGPETRHPFLENAKKLKEMNVDLHLTIIDLQGRSDSNSKLVEQLSWTKSLISETIMWFESLEHFRERSTRNTWIRGLIAQIPNGVEPIIEEPSRGFPWR